MKLTINIILSLGIICFLSVYSNEMMAVSIVPLFILCCFITSMLLTTWTKGTFKEKIKKTIPYSFPINTVAFLIGYAIETLKVL